jgi:hypothetical protein
MAACEDLLTIAAIAFVVAGVAVTADRALFSNPIPWKDKKPLLERYGSWAVNRAEAFCPHNDVACVEREARRLIASYRYRRQL